VATEGACPESAIAPQTNSAAAELDHFSLREKIGTRTVLAESPELVCYAKHGPTDSGQAPSVATSFWQASNRLATWEWFLAPVDIS
jgi:hypothetical protein